MKINVIGAGGLGGYFGARFAQAGYDVTFVARGAHLAAMRSSGIRLEGDVASALVAPIRATDDVRALDPADVVIVATKLWDLEDVVRQIAPTLGPQSTVVSFQNGIDAAGRIGAIVGDERVIGGIGYISAAVSAPGTIAVTGAMQRLVVGELGGGTSPRVEAFVAACAAAHVEAIAHADIVRALWEKFVFIVGLSGACCACRSAIGPIRTDPYARSLLQAIMRETVEVGRAQGVALDPAFADERLAFLDLVPPSLVASMYVDLQRGRRLELPWLGAKVVELGERAGVATPANRFVRDALWLHAAGT